MGVTNMPTSAADRASARGTAPPSAAAAARSTKLARTVIPLHPSPAPASQQLKVLQWNILADGLAQNGDFVKVPSEVLEWSFRAPLLLAEILESGADVICLQECNHYDELLRLLRPRGYCGAFYAKSFSPACRYDCPPDGLAIFYRSSRLEQRGPAAGHTYMSEAGCRQSQGFLAVRLHDSVAGRDLLVVTTHLKAKEGVELDAMRLRQAQQLLAWLDAATGLATVESYDSGDDLIPVDVVSGGGNSTTHPDAADKQPPPQASARNTGTGASTAATSAGDGTRSTGPCASPPASGDANRVRDSSSGAASGQAATPAVGSSSNGVHPPADGSSSSSVQLRAGGSGGNGVHPPGGQVLQASAASHNGAHAVVASAAAAAAGGGGAMPIILTGDFNTTLGSPAWKAFSSHPIGLQCLWSARAPPEALTAAPVTAGEQAAAGQQGQVGNTAGGGGGGNGASASSLSSSDDAPQEFTTWKYRTNGESKRIIDFILSTRASLRPTSRWRMLSEEEIGPHGLPSAAYGSDHVAVFASFEWQDDSNR